MAVTEQIGRSGSSKFTGSERRRMYVVTGAASENDALGQAVAQITADLGGTVLDGLALTNLEVDETDSAGEYRATATFGFTQQQALIETRTGFEFGQETIRAKRALLTRRFKADDFRGDPPDHGTLIGVTRDGDGRINIEGIDIPATSFTFSKTRVVPLALINSGLLADIGSIDKHVNAKPFAGFPAGEVLFLGATGNQRSEDEYEITHRFSRRPNEVNLAIGGRLVQDPQNNQQKRLVGVIRIPLKRGWEYLEIIHADRETSDGNSIVPTPRYALIHQVFEFADFGFLNLE